jgi:hypothetical protein
MKVTPPINKKTVDVNDFFKDLEKKIEKKEDNWV